MVGLSRNRPSRRSRREFCTRRVTTAAATAGLAVSLAVLTLQAAWPLSPTCRVFAADRQREAEVAAMVGAEAVSVDEVRRMIELVAGERELPSSLRPMAEARVLEELVARRLVLAYAKRTQTMVALNRSTGFGEP